jgi:HAD superfamily hydrolase (TIGR01509 family)
MIRGIIFDCFGVLYQGSVGHLYELTPPSRRAELENLSLSSDYGYVSRDDFLAQVSVLTEKTTREVEMIMQSDHIRNTAMIAYVKTLRANYKVAMLSNVGRGVIGRLFSTTELDELFDTVILSSEIGMVKPDPAIFTYTSDKLGVLPEDCLMVDDLQVNIDGAAQAGMRGVVFNTTDKFMTDANDLLTQPY